MAKFEVKYDHEDGTFQINTDVAPRLVLIPLLQDMLRIPRIVWRILLGFFRNLLRLVSKALEAWRARIRGS